MIAAALARRDAAEMTLIESAPLAGQAFALAHFSDGRTLRLNASGAEAAIEEADMRAALEAAGGALAGAGLRLMTGEDSYCYGHHDAVELPVWRVDTAENSSRAVYVSAASGRVLRTVDSGGRANRWLMSGLHSLDFPGLRARPVWDIVVLPLLAGVTLLCLIGVWLSWDRVRRDVRLLSRRRLSRRSARP